MRAYYNLYFSFGMVSLKKFKHMGVNPKYPLSEFFWKLFLSKNNCLK